MTGRPWWVVVGFPGEQVRSRIYHRQTNQTLGFVRESQAHGPRRWFPEDAAGLPIEGTFTTKSAAVEAVLAARASDG